MRRRRRHRAFALTSLIDVLFILLFAALMQAQRAAQSAPKTPDAGEPGVPDAGELGVPDAGTPDAGTPDAGAPDAGAPDAGAPDSADSGSSHLVRSQKLARRIAGAVQNRDVFVVEVTAAGEVSAMARWSRGQQIRRDRAQYRLLRPVPPGESDEEFVYGDPPAPDSEPRLCSLVRQHMTPAAADLGMALVMVLVDTPRERLPIALYRGLRQDLANCGADAAGVGVFFDPGEQPAKEQPDETP